MNLSQRYSTSQQLLFYWWFFGIYSILHHKIVDGAWTSANQAWWCCHGKMGVIALITGSILLVVILAKTYLSTRYNNKEISMMV